MTPADSARLELAKRAYEATQPTEREVQTGVRRARLSLRRTKPRRRWMLKGLVFVVLALGSLAYAKPHALGELVERGVPLLRGGVGKQRAALTVPTPVAPVVTPVTTPAAAAAPPPVATTDVALVAPPPPTLPRRRATKAPPSVATSAAPLTESAPTPQAPTTAPRGESVSEWGRVGQALARGDEAGALSALGKLSESDDARTRDKADLGRAQLLMAHGNREQACALARALTRRRAGGHIERQASMLLKDCAR